jgi:hypothetical protein
MRRLIEIDVGDVEKSGHGEGKSRVSPFVKGLRRCSSRLKGPSGDANHTAASSMKKQGMAWHFENWLNNNCVGELWKERRSGKSLERGFGGGLKEKCRERCLVVLDQGSFLITLLRNVVKGKEEHG